MRCSSPVITALLFLTLTLCQAGCGVLDSISESLPTGSFRLPTYEGEFEGELVSVPVDLGSGPQEVVALRVRDRPDEIDDLGTSPTPKTMTDEKSARLYVDGTFDKAEVFLLTTRDGEFYRYQAVEQRRVRLKARFNQSYGQYSDRVSPASVEGRVGGRVSVDAGLIVLQGDSHFFPIPKPSKTRGYPSAEAKQ